MSGDVRAHVGRDYDNETTRPRKPPKVKWFRPWKDHEDIINNPQFAHLGSQPDRQIHYSIQVLDDLGFQWLIWLVAGSGFFVDGYLLFADNFALPILGFLYWKTDQQSDHETAINCVTLSGAILGQIVLGILADIYGRSKVYGWELLIIIVSSLAISMSSQGMLSMRISPWLIFWRFVIGIGVGAEYPITAVMTSEFAPTPIRGRMLAAVFSMQSFGQFFAALVTFAALAGRLPLDSVWRLLFGLAAVPAAVAILFRFTIPESPRFTFDVSRNPKKANMAIEALAPAGAPVGAEAGVVMASEGGVPINNLDDHDAINAANGENNQVDRTSSSEGDASQHEDLYYFPPEASFDDFMSYFVHEKNWMTLVATAGTWFFLDLAFFGLGLNSPQIVTGVWKGCNSTIIENFTPSANYKWNTEPGLAPANISTPTDTTTLGSSTAYQQMFEDNESGFMVIVSIAAIVGSVILIWLIKFFNRKWVLCGGFFLLMVLFFILGGILFNRIDYNDSLQNGVHIAVNFFYAFCQFVFNFAPNALTFMFPAEVFPTRYRCTCHGISAAAGKLGSVVAQLILIKIQYSSLNNCQNKPDRGLGMVLLVFGAVMLFGALLALMIPKVQDKVHGNISLESLSKGRHPERREEREEKLNRNIGTRWKKTDLLPQIFRKKPTVDVVGRQDTVTSGDRLQNVAAHPDT